MNNLSKKLRITPGSRVLCLGAPESFASLLEPLADGATLSTRANGKFGVVMLFVTDSKALEKGLPKATAALDENSVFWICYPKKARALQRTSRATTDGKPHSMQGVELGFVWVEVSTLFGWMPFTHQTPP